MMQNPNSEESNYFSLLRIKRDSPVMETPTLQWLPVCFNVNENAKDWKQVWRDCGILVA